MSNKSGIGLWVLSVLSAKPQLLVFRQFPVRTNRAHRIQECAYRFGSVVPKTRCFLCFLCVHVSIDFESAILTPTPETKKTETSCSGRYGMGGTSSR